MPQVSEDNLRRIAEDLKGNIVDNLLSSSSGLMLSAKQGKILNDLLSDKVDKINVISVQQAIRLSRPSGFYYISRATDAPTSYISGFIIQIRNSATSQVVLFAPYMGGGLYISRISSSTGAWGTFEKLGVTVTNSLTSTSTTEALSAYQGKVLNDGKVDKQQSSSDVGKVLGINSDGLLVPVDPSPGGVTDVQVDGSSVVSGGVANIDLSGKVNISDIVDDLTIGGSDVPLSAEQGKALKDITDTKIAGEMLGENPKGYKDSTPSSSYPMGLSVVALNGADEPADVGFGYPRGDIITIRTDGNSGNRDMQINLYGHEGLFIRQYDSGSWGTWKHVSLREGTATVPVFDNGAEGTISVIRRGGFATVYSNGTRNLKYNASGFLQLFTLPAGFQPIVNVYGMCSLGGTSESLVKVDASGAISLFKLQSASNAMYFSVTFPCKW